MGYARPLCRCAERHGYLQVHARYRACFWPDIGGGTTAEQGRHGYQTSIRRTAVESGQQSFGVIEGQLEVLICDEVKTARSSPTLNRAGIFCSRTARVARLTQNR